jgi:hypothetical protein
MRTTTKKKRRRRKRKTKKTGSKRSFLLVCALLPLALIWSGTVWAGKKKEAPQSYGIVAGTVFRESGLSLPGAEVEVSPDPDAGQTPLKLKPMKGVSDGRGEFAFRVPPVEMRYKIAVKAKKFQPDEKLVTVHGEERTEVTFQLHEESK